MVCSSVFCLPTSNLHSCLCAGRLPKCVLRVVQCFLLFTSLFECNANPTADGAVNQSYLRYGVGSHFVTVGVQVLHLTVIGPFVRHVEGGGDGASVGVDAATFEQILVKLLVKVVDGVVECQQDDLRHLFHGHIDFARNEWE